MEDAVVPIYFVRYEELVDDPLTVMSGVFSFILGIDEEQVAQSILGNQLVHITRPKEVSMVAESIKSLDSGKLKKAYSKNIEWFKDEHISMVKTTLAKELHYFGYSNPPRSSQDSDACSLQSGAHAKLTIGQSEHSLNSTSTRKKQSSMKEHSKYSFFHFNDVTNPLKVQEHLKLYDGFKKHNSNMLSFMIERQQQVDSKSMEVFLEQG